MTQASSSYLNRAPRSYENYLVARLARSIANGWRNETVEQTLAELDHARRVIKPRQSLRAGVGV